MVYFAHNCALSDNIVTKTLCLKYYDIYRVYIICLVKKPKDKHVCEASWKFEEQNGFLQNLTIHLGFFTIYKKSQLNSLSKSMIFFVLFIQNIIS